MLKSILQRLGLREPPESDINELATKDIGQLTGEDILTLRRTYPRFRVLVLGPSNAGKTTLLERLSNSSAGERIMTRNGKRIKDIPKGSRHRGDHKITDETTYASNPFFVFHDSSGFEAGSEEEINAIWKFIRQRSSTSPSNQLHAIWICIPTDNDRPLGFLNAGLFTKSTGAIPLIGIFTKLNGRETKVMEALLGSYPSPYDMIQPSTQVHVEQKTAEFVRELETEFRLMPHPPVAFISIPDMREVSERSTKSCYELLQITADSLPLGVLKLLLQVTVRNRFRRAHTAIILKIVLAKWNILERTSPTQDEESELHADVAFGTLVEKTWADRAFRYDALYLGDDRFSLDPDLSYWSKACAPLLALSRQLPMISTTDHRYLTFICLVILLLRHHVPAESGSLSTVQNVVTAFVDAPETGRIARSINVQINAGLEAKGMLQLSSEWRGGVAARLADIIEENTPA